ncbi:hypothetical protein ACOSQ3_001536 [Xanthoceras sorbifolium]
MLDKSNICCHVELYLYFLYDNKLHYMLQVTQQNFNSCNVTSPIAKYTSGHDRIIVNKLGHFYFVCGSPGHCNNGEKFDIQVIPNTTTKLPKPSLSFIPISTVSYPLPASFGHKLAPGIFT